MNGRETRASASAREVGGRQVGTPAHRRCARWLVASLAVAVLAACEARPLSLSEEMPGATMATTEPAQPARQGSRSLGAPTPARSVEPVAPGRSAIAGDAVALNRSAQGPGQGAGRANGGKAGAVGPVVAVGPSNPHASVGNFLHGTKFEPPLGRVLHGMGEWASGNVAYLKALDDPALQPASQLVYLPIGDWPRSWDSRNANTRKGLSDLAAAGCIPHIEISLFGVNAKNVHDGIDGAIASSDRYDDRIRDIAHTVRSIKGPVFVRIGAEFNGQWNPYTAFNFPAAYRKIVTMFRAEGVANAAFVWCYEPDAPGDFDDVDPKRGPRWYPGDDVVDWFALDVFNADDFAGPLEKNGTATAAGRSRDFLKMALDHKRPVMLAETSAAYVQITPDQADGQADWAAYFVPFFQFLDANPNIEAFYYVNVDWSKTGDYGSQGWKDGRIDQNQYITEHYRTELKKPRYLHSGHVDLLNGVAGLPPPVPVPDEPTKSAKPGAPR